MMPPELQARYDEFIRDYEECYPNSAILQLVKDLRACADELAAHLQQKKAHEDDLSRRGTPEIRHPLQSSAPADGVISALVPDLQQLQEAADFVRNEGFGGWAADIELAIHRLGGMLRAAPPPLVSALDHARDIATALLRDHNALCFRCAGLSVEVLPVQGDRPACPACFTFRDAIAEALRAASVSAPPAQAPTDDDETPLSRLSAVTLSEGQDPRVNRNEV